MARRAAVAALVAASLLGAACGTGDDEASVAVEPPSTTGPGGWDCGERCDWDAPSDALAEDGMAAEGGELAPTERAPLPPTARRSPPWRRRRPARPRPATSCPSDRR